MNNKSVIFLGNYLFRDDKVPLLIGESLRDKLERDGFTVYIVEKTGYILMEYLEGMDIVFIVDSIKTGRYEIGSIIVVKPEDFKIYSPLSPHYVGIPETLKLMSMLNLNPPKHTIIIGIEVEDPYTLDESISPSLAPIIDTISKKLYREIISMYNSICGCR